MIKLNMMLAAAGILVAQAQTAGAGAPASTTQREIKIASVSHRENGCSESSASFKAAIPDYKLLDRTYQGPLAGIKIIEREHNGTASYGNLAFVDGGAAITGSLSARGAGTRLRMPFGGGNVCTRAAGANIAVDIYAVYQPINAEKEANNSQSE
jgi:hypothetical protein